MTENRRRAPLVLGLLAAVAVVIAGYWIVSAPPVVPAVPQSAADAGVDAMSADPAQAPDQGTEGATSRQEIDVAPGRAAGDPGGRRVNVQLLDAATRLPVSAADVLYTRPDWTWRDFGMEEAERLQDLRARDLESFLGATGVTVVSDAEGRCTIPGEQPHVEVVARKGGLFGSTVIDYDQGMDRVILMHEDVSFEVTVLDYQGRVASGVQIVAYPHLDTPAREGARLGRTDEAGVFPVLHVGSLAGDLDSGQVVLAASIPGGESPRIAVDPRALPPGGARMRLPPTGSWTFQLTDAEGVALPSEELGYQILVLSVVGQERPTWYRRLDEDTACRFDHVVLYGTFDVLAFRSYREPDLAGPSKSEPDRFTQIRMPDNALILHARAVDEEGRVLADDSMQNIAMQEGEAAEFVSLLSGDDGRFTWVVLEHNPDKELPIELRLWVDNDLDVEVKHYLRLPRGLAAGHHDLGDLRFDAGPLLVRGRVEFVNGGVPEPMNLSIRAEVDGESALVVGTTTWPEPGVFEIRGFAPTEELRLAVSDVRYRGTAEAPFRAGDTGVLLRVSRRGEVTASFVVEEGAPWHMCRYFLEPRFEPELNPSTEAFRLERAGDRVVTNWRALEVGTYDLFVRVPGLTQPVVHIADLEVTGGPLQDPRLDGIAMELGARVASVTLVDPDGNAIAEEGAGLIVGSPGSGVPPGFLPADDGVVEVLLVDQVEARAVAPGFLPEVLQVRTGMAVELEPAPGLSLTVELPAALPARATARLTVSAAEDNPLHGALAVGYRNDPRLAVGGLTILATRVRSPGLVTVDLDPGGHVDLKLEQPGDYRVTLALVAGRTTAELDLADQSTLHWEGTGAKAVNIEVDQAVFQNALNEIRD